MESWTGDMMRFKRDRRFSFEELISDKSFVKLDVARGRLSLDKVKWSEVKFGRWGKVTMVSSAKVAQGGG
jgi:hypothetical protein